MIGGDSEAIAGRLEAAYQTACARSTTALRIAVQALGGPDRALTPDELEVAVLARGRTAGGRSVASTTIGSKLPLSAIPAEPATEGGDSGAAPSDGYRGARWSGGSSASRTSTASRAPSAVSAVSAPTRWRATSSAGSSRGAAAPTCSSPTAPGSTSTSVRTPSTPRPSATRSTTSSRTTRPVSASSNSLLAAAEQRLARRGHPRRHLPVQEQHRLRGQQLRLPRELPHQPARRLRVATPRC